MTELDRIKKQMLPHERQNHEKVLATMESCYKSIVKDRQERDALPEDNVEDHKFYHDRIRYETGFFNGLVTAMAYTIHTDRHYMEQEE